MESDEPSKEVGFNPRWRGILKAAIIDPLTIPR
jgi:hypothetical protein